MKKFRYTIMSALITALALFVLSCSTGGDDDDYTPPYTPPDTLPGPVEVEASGSITLPAPLLSNGTTAVIPLDPVGGFTLTVMLELSGGSTYRLHLTVSGKEYLLSCVSVGESNPLATAWTLTGGSGDDIELTFAPSGAYTLSYTPEWIPIASAEQLQKIGVNYPLNGKYELTDDITLTSGWTPIGNGTAPFTGTFDGEGHSIAISSFPSAGVNISSAVGPTFLAGFTNSIIARGLFAYTENAVIKDIDITVNLSSQFVITSTPQQLQLFGTVAAAAVNTAFTNINISGGGLNVKALSALELKLGGITGLLMNGSSMTGCSMSGNVKALDDTGTTAAGGLVGWHWGIIENCSVTGNVSVESTVSGNDFQVRAGGLAGQIQGGDGGTAAVRKSYSTGTVSAQGNSAGAVAGGIVGNAWGSAEITDCYSTGNVSAEGEDSADVGGIMGSPGDSSAIITIARCYASGNITVSGSSDKYAYAGGIAGRLGTGSGNITGCAVLSGPVSYTGHVIAKRIVGEKNSGFSLTNNIAYKDMEINSVTVSMGDADTHDGINGLSKTSTELSNQATYTGWDFSTVWKMEGSPLRPVLQWQ